MINRTDAEQIVRAFFHELSGRRGVSREVEMIRQDDEVYAEMYESHVGIVMALGRPLSAYAGDRWNPKVAGDQ